VSEIEELRRELARIARELEELKRRKELLERGLSVHDPLGVSAALKRSLRGVEEGSRFVCAGVVKRGGRVVDSWNCYFDLRSVLAASPERVAKLVAPLSSRQRVAILKALIEGPKTPSELSRITGMRGGELYHHLKELIRSGYVEARGRGVYALTFKGEAVFSVVAGLASHLEPPTDEELEEELRGLTSEAD